MVIKPLYDRVLIKRAKEEKTASGIILPETAQETPTEGVVMEVGEGLLDDKGQLRPLKVKKGDKVLLTKWGGNEVKIDGVDFVIVKEADILAIVQ